MTNPTRCFLAVAIAATGVLAACKPKAAPIEVAPAPAVPASPAGLGAPDTMALERERTAAAAVAEREARQRAAEERDRRILAEPIHFDLDRSELTLDARARLDAKVEILRTRILIRLRVEGHADERGSTEYNMALGMIRAGAAKRYLVQRDIMSERIDITSFGEERPTCSDATESCWQANRRSAFVVTAP